MRLIKNIQRTCRACIEDPWKKFCPYILRRSSVQKRLFFIEEPGNLFCLPKVLGRSYIKKTLEDLQSVEGILSIKNPLNVFPLKKIIFL